MELFFRKKNKTILIQIVGEIDHHTVKEIRYRTESILTETGYKNIIFDFQNVSFMDSSGIGMLIGRYKQLRPFGGAIAIASANEKIKEIIYLAGLTKLLRLFDSIEEALEDMEGRKNNAV